MARDYLKIYEIEEVLANAITPGMADIIMADMRREAEICLCAARDRMECCCGAWDEDE